LHEERERVKEQKLEEIKKATGPRKT